MVKKNNDKIILSLKKDIDNKEKLLSKVDKFSPITNCNLELENIRYNLNVLDKKQVQYLIIKLTIIKKVNGEIFPDDNIEFSGYKIDDWIADLHSKYNILNIKTEESRLKILKSKLHNLLSNDTKVELELNDLKSQI